MTVRAQQSLGIRLAIFCWAGAIAFSLDQLTKRWVLSNIPAGSRRPFIPDVLDLFHVQNDGAAFSIGSGRPLFFAALTAVVVLGMMYIVMREKNLPYPLIAILGQITDSPCRSEVNIHRGSDHRAHHNNAQNGAYFGKVS